MFHLSPLKVCYEATFAVTRYLYDMWHSPCTTHALAYFMADNLLSNFVTPVACGPLKREQGSLPLWWWYRTDGRNWWNPPPTVVGEEVKGMSNKERKATDIVLYFLRHRVWNEVRLVILVWRGNIEERGIFNFALSARITSPKR